jgi:competence protein ComGC
MDMMDRKVDSIKRNDITGTSTGSGCLYILVISVLIVFGVLSLMVSMRSSGEQYSCQSNCKNIGTALEMYSTDYNGNYPSSMNLLTGNYLRHIPTCLVSGTDTYSSGYQVYNNPGMEIHRFTFFCNGNNHTYSPTYHKLFFLIPVIIKHKSEIPENYPQYNSTDGLIWRPASSMTKIK